MVPFAKIRQLFKMYIMNMAEELSPKKVAGGQKER